MKVHEALADVMEEVRSVAKSERNTHQNYNFRGIDAVVNAVGPALRKHRVVIIPSVLDYRSESVAVGKNNTQMRLVTVTVEYKFVGPEGDCLSAVSVGESMDSGDKATPKAMSVALRTCMLQALMLPTDEPDPDSFSYDLVVPEFVADDPASWPAELTVAQAKKVFLHACNGDKECAKNAWVASGLGTGPFLPEVIAEKAVTSIEAGYSEDEKPF
jgi:hypothetical protein